MKSSAIATKKEKLYQAYLIFPKLSKTRLYANSCSVSSSSSTSSVAPVSPFTPVTPANPVNPVPIPT